MPLQVRTLAPDEFAAAIDAMSVAFLERPDVDRVAELVREVWDPSRTWGAFDEAGRLCGTFRSWPTEITVPGGARLAAGAVAGVTALPTHRRRGALTALADAEHRAMRERGETMSLLYASEYPIYGRFGYAPATRTATWTLQGARGLFHGPPSTGVELATPDEAGRDLVREVFEAWRARRHGEIRRRPFTWDLLLGLRDEPWGERWKGFLAVRRDGSGRPDGFVRYRAEPRWVDRRPQGTVEVQELHALTSEAYAALWRYLAEIDLVSTVRSEGRSPSEALPWLLRDGRAAVLSEQGDALWVRLLDVPGALEGRAYEQPGCVVLEVVDGPAGGRQRLVLDASPEGTTCRPTTREPDLTLPVAALGGAYLGGTRLSDLVLLTGADEHRRGALARADGLLRTAEEPWCSTHF